MARKRNIDPAFFRHQALYAAEKASGLPLRLAFAGLWCVADREGRFRWRPWEIRLDVMPYDDGLDFGAVMDALAAAGFVRRYVVDGEPFGDIPQFTKYQHIHPHEAKSKIPACNVITSADIVSECQPEYQAFQAFQAFGGGVQPATSAGTPTTTSSSPGASAESVGLPPAYQPDLDALLRAAAHPAVVLTAVRTLATGKHPQLEGVSPQDVGEGLRAMLLDRAPAAKLARYVGTAHRIRTAPFPAPEPRQRSQDRPGRTNGPEPAPAYHRKYRDPYAAPQRAEPIGDVLARIVPTEAA